MGDALGGGVMVAVAAALWIAYLVPSWLHRRQYVAMERNAVRMQQVMRVLAETAETPEHVRVEATARAVAAQERVLREREAAERAREKAELEIAMAERRATERAAADAIRAAKAAADAGRSRRRIVRRARAITSLFLLTALGALVVGVVVAIAGSGFTVAIAGAAGVFAGLFVLSSLARAGRSVAIGQRPAATAAPVAVFEPVEWAEEERPATVAWTPQPLPKPLSQSPGTAAAAAMDSAEQAEALRRAAVLAAMSQKAAEINEPVVRRLAPARVEPAASVADPRFARMGFVDGAEPGMTDLDAVLRRRRAG
ncbi:hypothetical protein WDJ51_10150 [Rathayibacter sp. YIM 133350]|uniref:hypothetical protein n=1 Tax=Rathayibacter sp. YIM 133350 TaxID=3131992 RepID=UPI00307DBBDA